MSGPTPTPGSGPAPHPPPILLSDAAVPIEGRPVLRHIDLRVDRGEFVAVMGPNGSGKSTLIRALVGLRPLARGELQLFGTPVTRFRSWSRVGFVPQHAAAASGIPVSVREVVASGRLSRRRALRPPGRADRAAIEQALDVVGLTDRAREAVNTLSGGQQQRVLIARALAAEPELLVLDEPTAGVDLENQRALAESLGTLTLAGTTVVLVAHELGPLRPLVDRTVVLRQGRVVHDGLPLADHAMPLEPWEQVMGGRAEHDGAPLATTETDR